MLRAVRLALEPAVEATVEALEWAAEFVGTDCIAGASSSSVLTLFGGEREPSEGGGHGGSEVAFGS